MRYKLRYKNPALAAALARTGLKGKDLAAQCGISPLTVSALLNKRRDPKPETARAIAQALGLTPDEIGFGSDIDAVRQDGLPDEPKGGQS